MNKTILFSPVGGTDPISASNMCDGSMLHICRWYRPDKIYLYMSKEILALHEKDNRYIYCLDKLSEWLDWKYEYEIIKRPEMDNVQDFDYFYQDFRGIIKDIMSDMDESDTLLLNISSGTPAMKSGLLVLKTLGEFDCRAIQVTTPVKGMNEHIHRDYDVGLLWEIYRESSEAIENRCREVQCPTLSMIKQEEIIKRLVAGYDYQAAIEIMSTMPQTAVESYRELIVMASRRLLLDFSGVDQILARDKRFMLPVKDSDLRKYFEYALSLQIKLKKREYADFIRGISPLIADLFEKILEKQTDIKLKDYCIQRPDKSWRWDQKKLYGSDVYEILQREFGSEVRLTDVYSSQLCVLIQEFSKDREAAELVKELRTVEQGLRNVAAHQIVSITDEIIKNTLGFTGKQITDRLKRAFGYAGINIRKEYWSSYDEMNNIILSEINNRA